MDKKVKLLIVTQKVDSNDPILGFFVRWVEEFAKHTEKLTVICLEEGEHNLPKNVQVLSLGKKKYFREEVRHRGAAERRKKSFLEEKIFSKAIYSVRFYKYIWQERKNYDVVFVHMNPIYVVLGGIFWRSWGKKVGLWYVHKSVDLKLRLSEKITHYIFTVSKKSFRLSSTKINIMGHGVDVGMFQKEKNKENKNITIVMPGRISPTKNQKMLVDTIEILKKIGIEDVVVGIIGGPVTIEDKQYAKEVQSMVFDKELVDNVRFIGTIPHKDIVAIYEKYDILINLSDTGSIDKTVLEAMASGIKVLTCNEAFEQILSSQNFTSKNPKDIASKIIALSKMSSGESLRNYVVKNHNLNTLIPNIINIYAQKF